jgi:hypothetical protein
MVEHEQLSTSRRANVLEIRSSTDSAFWRGLRRFRRDGFWVRLYGHRHYVLTCEIEMFVL